LSGVVSASNINVLGVTWDPDYPGTKFTQGDFHTSTASFRQWYTDASGPDFMAGGNLTPDLDEATVSPGVVNPGIPGSYLVGVGLIEYINDKPNSNFMCSTCELTYAFGGIIYDGELSDGSAFDRTNSSGWLNFYVDSSKDASLPITGQSTVNQFTDGALWLSLSLDFLQERPGWTVTTGFIDSYWSITGGAAAANFMRDTKQYGIDDMIGFSDFHFAANATFEPPFLVATGSANGYADTITIPEPNSLALLGLGMLGFGAARRKTA